MLKILRNFISCNAAPIDQFPSSPGYCRRLPAIVAKIVPHNIVAQMKHNPKRTDPAAA